VGAAIAAIACGVVAGASVGLLVAAVSRGAGVRPRQWLRDNAGLSRRVGGWGATGAAAVVVAGIFGDGHDRTGLAFTCIAVTLLIAIASWLVLVEPDDDGSTEAPDEPEWWPAFERELETWTRRSRLPAHRR
jgi:hypothetical protein